MEAPRFFQKPREAARFSGRTILTTSLAAIVAFSSDVHATYAQGSATPESPQQGIPEIVMPPAGDHQVKKIRDNHFIDTQITKRGGPIDVVIVDLTDKGDIKVEFCSKGIQQIATASYQENLSPGWLTGPQDTLLEHPEATDACDTDTLVVGQVDGESDLLFIEAQNTSEATAEGTDGNALVYRTERSGNNITVDFVGTADLPSSVTLRDAVVPATPQG